MLHIQATCLKETEKAILVRVNFIEEWIPKNLISKDSEVKKTGDFGTLVIPIWLGYKKQLIEEPEDICPFCHDTSDMCQCSPTDFDL